MAAKMPKQISVQVRDDESGWVVATSDDFPGLFVSRPTLGEVVSQIAEAVELLVLARYHRRVTARMKPEPRQSPPLRIPVEILAQTRAG